MGHTKGQVLLGVASDSSGSSPDIFVGDCRLLSVSIQTSTGSASNVTIALSNDGGFTAGIGFRSVVTVLPNQGIYAIDPGARWIRAERAAIGISTTSNVTVILNRYYD
jgi:hypothetical protein